MTVTAEGALKRLRRLHMRHFKPRLYVVLHEPGGSSYWIDGAPCSHGQLSHLVDGGHTVVVREVTPGYWGAHVPGQP